MKHYRLPKQSVQKKLKRVENRFHRRDRLQVGALCYRKTGNGFEYLLLTSLGTGRWIIPKGWPERKRDHAEVARIEAYEEAGIEGKLSAEPLDLCKATKGRGDGSVVRTRMIVFLLKAEKELEDYPEKGKRQKEWMSAKKAISRIDEPELAELIDRVDDELEDGKRL